MPRQLVRCSGRHLPLLEGHDALHNETDKLQILLAVDTQIELLGKTFQMQVLETSLQKPVPKQKVGHQRHAFLEIKLLLRHKLLHCLLIEQFAELANTVGDDADFFEELAHDDLGDLHK